VIAANFEPFSLPPLILGALVRLHRFPVLFLCFLCLDLNLLRDQQSRIVDFEGDEVEDSVDKG